MTTLTNPAVPFRFKPFWDKAVASDYSYVILLSALFAASLALRLHGIADTPPWTDETFTYVVSKLPATTILFGRIDNHPALFYCLQHIWHSFEPGIDAIRVPAAVFGAITVPVVGFAVADLLTRRAGFYAATFLALSTIHVYFSQEARAYTLVCLGLAFAIWGLMGFVQRDKPRLYGALYVIGGAIAVYSHAIGLFYLAALNLLMLLALALQGEVKVPFIRIVVLNAILLLVCLPWLIALPGSDKTFPGLSETPADIIQWMVMNTIGFPGFPVQPMQICTLALCALFVYGTIYLWKAGNKTWPVLFFGSLFVYPAVIFVANLHVNIIANRIFLPCALVCAFLYAASLSVVKNTWAQVSLFAVFSALSFMSLTMEHAVRMKTENVVYSIGAADARGFADAPILGCGMMGALSPYVLIKDRPIYYLLGPSFVRFNQAYEKTFAMPIADHRTMDAQGLDKYAGGGILVTDAQKEFAPYNHLVVLNTYCSPAKMAPTNAALMMLGFHKAGIVPPPSLRLTLEANGKPTDLWVRNGLN